jgi:hypothetical protein
MKLNVGMTSLAALGLLACSDSDNTPATETDYDDVAQALTATISTGSGGGDILSFQDSTSIALGVPSLDLSLDASGAFAGSRLGLMYDYTANCVAADGSKLAQCDGSSAAADVNVNWSGELSLPHVTAQVQRTGAWKLSKLQSDTAELSGTGSFDVDLELASIFRAATHHYALTYSANYDHLQLVAALPIVIGGSIAYSVDAERMASGTLRDGDAKFHIDAALTFAADGGVSLSLDGKYHYAIDTTTGSVQKM